MLCLLASMTMPRQAAVAIMPTSRRSVWHTVMLLSALYITLSCCWSEMQCLFKCRGSVSSVKQHSNVWYSTSQPNAPEAAALLGFPLHQSEALRGCAQEAGESTLAHSTCNHAANEVVALLHPSMLEECHIDCCATMALIQISGRTVPGTHVLL